MRKLSNTRQFDNSFQKRGEERLVLSCLHTAIGHSHLEAILNVTGLPCMAEGTFKGVERSVGYTVETALSGACNEHNLEKGKVIDNIKLRITSKDQQLIF